MIGKTVLQYEILEQIGEGGMGTVYKAKDTKLDRFVALKFLPSQIATTEDEKARFIQEAKAASAMNHPNICTIYDIQEDEGKLFIVMEYIDGVTLKDNTQTLSDKKILEYSAQIAEGLAAAHEKGIVHRDIKPDNIMIRKDGIVQIMDFGLAKLYTDSNVSRLTKAGTTMGTMGYMSPEQVQGLDVDHRTDIFSLGVVLYELFAGESPFKGMHETAIMYEIVNVEVPPISTIKQDIDPQLEVIILECLEKDRDDRCQSAKELARNLRKIKRVSTGTRTSRMYNVNSAAFQAQTNAQAVNPSTSGSFAIEAFNKKFYLQNIFKSRYFLSSIILILLLTVSYLIYSGETVTQKAVTKFTINIGNDKVINMSAYPALAISHDGSKIVVKANNNFYLRKMNSRNPVLVSGTENAASPFFSPDDKSLGFFKSGKLMQISLNGETPTVLADVSDNRGGTWNQFGQIVFAPKTTEPLWIVSEMGGGLRKVTSLDTLKNERTHRWPSFLPDGKHVIFTVGLLSSPAYYEKATIDVADMETGKRKTIIKGASTARYINTGHILFSRKGILYVVPFDLDKLKVTGQPIPVIRGISGTTSSGSSNYMVSDNGTLVYIAGLVEGGKRKIIKIDLNGKRTILDAKGQPYTDPSFSPDNKNIAFAMNNSSASLFDIWIFNIKRKTLNRFTFDGVNRSPKWSPDGKNIAFRRYDANGKRTIFIKPSNGIGKEKKIVSVESESYLDQWTKDGKYLILEGAKKGREFNITAIPLKGGKKKWDYLDSKYDEYGGNVSPDGKWMAYLSKESGSYQIYVSSFPEKIGKWQITTDGGEEPRWSPDGKTIYYKNDTNLMSVPISFSPTFTPGIPKVVITDFPLLSAASGISYDISNDGKYFITTAPLKEGEFKNISVVLNWTEEVKKLTSKKE